MHEKCYVNSVLDLLDFSLDLENNTAYDDGRTHL